MTPGAHIEIVEPYPNDPSDLPCIKPRVVRINGTDVGFIAVDGIRIDPGDGIEQPLTVTLTLMPRRLDICAERID